MTWMRFDPDEFWSLDVVERMDLDAAGLLLWLISRSWKTGAIRDDPAHYKAMLRGKCKGFDRLWPIVREAFEEVEDGLRVDWVERERESAEKRLTSDAARQALQRTKRGKSRRSHTRVTRDSTVSHASTDGTDGRDGRMDDSSASGARVEVEVWAKVFSEFPTLDTAECRSAYREYVAMRKRRKRLTEWDADTLRKNLVEAERHGVVALIAAFDESARLEYQGVFPAKHSGRKATKGGTPTFGDMLDAQRKTGGFA